MIINSSIIIKLNILSIFLFFLVAASATEGMSDNCPAGTLFEPYNNICSEVSDLTQVYSQESMNTVQSFLQQENEQNSPQIDEVFDGLPMPFPGAPSAGIEYTLGTLQALESTRFVTKMYVQEGGLEASGPVDWLFTVIGGRIQKGIEPVGIYRDTPDGSLGLFDWSCSEEYPCQNGEPGPSWVLIQGFSDLSCNLTDINDKGGHKQTILLASNDSTKISDESPPRWSNQFYLWNYCDNSWDLVYQHEYRIDQLDCSVTYTNCARYANWIETFANPLPQINEVGFEDAMIFHDGNWSVLNTDNSRFFNDVSQWETFHLQPDHSYGVGNFTNDPIVISVDIDIRNKRNVFNPRSKGSIWVAVLSDTNSDTFFEPSSQINISTIEFGPNGAEVLRQKAKDINKDGLEDLLLRFRISETGIACEDTEAILTGETFDGANIVIGTGFIKTIGCKTKKHRY